MKRPFYTDKLLWLSWLYYAAHKGNELGDRLGPFYNLYASEGIQGCIDHGMCML